MERIIAFSHDLTVTVYRQASGDSPTSLALLLQRYAHELPLTPDDLQAILREGAAATEEMFASLDVSIADLRLERQADAAITALVPEGTATPADDAAAASVVTAPQAPTTEEARARLVREIEGTVGNAGHFDLNETVLTVLEALLRAGPFDRAVFCLLNEGRTELLGRFGLGEGVDALVKRLRFPLTGGAQGGAVGQAVQRRADLRVSALRNPSPDETRLLAMVAAQSLLLLPFDVDGKPLGAIYADRRSGEAPDAPTIHFANRLREQTARAMARAKRERETVALRSARIPAEAKSAYVLRVLKGEDVERISQETGVPVREIEAWRKSFLDGALQGLKASGDPA
jgi:hypothetical protein